MHTSKPTTRGRLSLEHYRILIQSWSHFIALGAGSGLLPKAPGTWGSFLAWPVALLLQTIPPPWLYVCIIIGFILSCRACQITGESLGIIDHPSIVLDEIFAVCILLLTVPPIWQIQLLAICLFRVFDITKPPPCNWIDDHIKSGLGVMLDDLMAALYAAGSLHLLLHYTSRTYPYFN